MDRDASNPSLNMDLDLSLEQKFKMRIFQELVEAMNPEETRCLLLEASKLLMLKNNIIKDLIKQDLSSWLN